MGYHEAMLIMMNYRVTRDNIFEILKENFLEIDYSCKSVVEI